MRVLITLVILAATALPLNAQALDLNNMTDEERLIFRQEIRVYLLDNPEVLIEAMDVYEQRQRVAEDLADQYLLSENAAEIFNDGISYVGGNPDGDLTVVEFMDYRCGYCRKAHDEVKQLISDDGNIRFIIKEYPILGPDSSASSKMAIATLQLFGADAYAALYEELIRFNGPLNDVAVRLVLDRIDVDADQVLKQMESPDVADHISKMHALARTLDISGTPTFVIGNQIVRGYVPLDVMVQIAEIARSVSN